MIARTWRGIATTAKADAYHRHFTSTVASHLKEIVGYQGAYLLRREANGQVEFIAVTLWDSIDTVKKFSGPNPEAAIVEPEARAALTTFDDYARHYEVAYSNDRTA